MLTDWPAVLLGILLSLAAGAGIGYGLGQQRAARELARLRSLVPEMWLLRWAARMVAYLIRTQPTDNDTRALEWVQRLFDIAARIEAAGAGAESVPQCITCRFYTLSGGDGNWCYMCKEPPEVEGECAQWKGKGE